MKTYPLKPHTHFIGRKEEFRILSEITGRNEARVIVVLGRRRVGKTELIEQFFREKPVLKFEGVQLDPQMPANQARNYQINRVLQQLSEYTESPPLTRIKIDSWYNLFNLIAGYLKEGEWVLYFEEVQWLAHYQDDFFSELKPIWDNQLRHNPRLTLVLCGSSPSFISSQLLSNKAFYNRTSAEILLREFSLKETKDFFGEKHSLEEVMLAYLTVGGIPEYLKRLQLKKSIFITLCENSFKPKSFFASEKDKIFVSSLSHNLYFEKIIHFLSQRKQATRNEIAKMVKARSGGYLTRILRELEACDFIESYTPVQLGQNSLVSRYTIKDFYLQYYFKFIHPQLKAIDNGDFISNPTRAIEKNSLNKWLGFAFERFCRKSHGLIAKKLGFSAVQYKSGAFFNRRLLQKRDFQIDLLFLRADHVITICEIKYYQSLVGTSVIGEMEEKIENLKREYPRAARATIHRVLITTHGAAPALQKRAYFDDVLTIEDLV